ncbi:hypothetical protein JW865_06780 [Candidatus Bathyarchaeota archaeon]|nr:hypothetical protein [Candidatus Bathyarchaeota archaeon]
MKFYVLVKFITVPLLLLSIIISTISNASLIPEEWDEAKFNYLFENDPSFKESIEKIRGIIIHYDFSDEAWIQVKILFNVIFEKMGFTLDLLSKEQLSEFRKEVEYIASNIRLIELEKNVETPSVQMTPEQEITYALTFVPKVKQPDFDTVGNGLTNVFIDVHEQNIYGYLMTGYNIIEVSLVWNDEDYPNNPLLDWFYDGVRQTLYGRLQDIETFFIVVDRSTGLFSRASFIKIDCVRGLVYITFDGCYSSTQTWTQNNHYEAKKDRYLWDRTNEHPWMWVNTWNHMLGEDQNNAYSHVTYNTWSDFTLQYGNRMTTENTIQWLYEYTNEIIYQAP